VQLEEKLKQAQRKKDDILERRAKALEDRKPTVGFSFVIVKV
jgi:hypothetical protein